MRTRRALSILAFLAIGVAATQVPWEDLTEADWIYALATRFALVDGHQVHYPTPTAELARILEGRNETAALRHLADARLNLGDRKGALEAMERWAAAEGPSAWDEAARWAASHHEMEAAFRAAERALPGLPEDAKRALADRRILWAERHPDLADALALRKARAELFPEDPGALEAWVRALEKAGRLAEAEQALAAAKALSGERRLLLRADLLTDHGDHRGAFQVLDGAVSDPWSLDFRQAYAQRAEKGAPTAPAAWRATLESRFDAGALTRLATYFQGQNRGDAAAGLLAQMDRRYGPALGRKDLLLMARLHGEIDAAPEAFRATLAAAHLGNAGEQTEDLADLARLALRAGGRPLAWGSYNDEAYRWAAQVDRTPGFWTGGLSFLLTGQDWKEPLDHLENESLPDRTFATARALAQELARRAPQHSGLASLRVALMERHVERGEGKAALALLPLVESAPPAVADEGRRIALLAARQTGVPLPEEIRLLKARLRFTAPDGGRPLFEEYASAGSEEPDQDAADGGEGRESRSWARAAQGLKTIGYRALLEEGLSRLEYLDHSHRASLDLILTELDRLPDAEDLWLALASRLESWNLDDELGPRFEQALKRFQGSGIWDKTARWYARRDRQAELKRLAEDVAARFGAAEIFHKISGAGDVLVQIPGQPPAGGRVRMVAWADWVRLRALERFPHSPTVFREAGRLMTASAWQRHDAAHDAKRKSFPVVVPDALLEERRWAILFVDAAQREAFFAEAMRRGDLEDKLAALEAKTGRTPVENLLLLEGWARLSRFERAAGAADRLSADYPGDGPLAQKALLLHRSLNGLESSHAAPARALVARAAPALEDASALWTELGELEEDRGKPEAASEAWKHLLDREPRNPKRISDLATLLWDYNHDREALAVVEEGRKRLGRPRFFAFETGVLRENVKDLEGAVREYLDALRPEAFHGYAGGFEQDQRSLRRLAQLLAKERVYRLVERRIQSLAPGSAEDERALAAFYPLATLEPPAPGLEWDADGWIDAMDMPNDPVGRAQRDERKTQERPREYDAIHRIGDTLLEKTREMAAKATAVEFLDVVESRMRPLLEARWNESGRIDFANALMARKAVLAPSEEDRIQQEMARAGFLSGKGRAREADAVWAALEPRIGALPEGSVRLRAEAGRAAYLERAKGVEPAAQEWRRITGRYPWSLGLLEDRLAFLNRSDKGEEARALLEGVIPKAAVGHREALLERLTQDALAASDLPRARRAVARLLAEEGLDDGRRLGAIHLLARLSYRENPGWDAYAFAKTEGPKLNPELQANLYYELARAADLEGAAAPVPGLWIEALNRRTDRAWLEAASRASRKAGKGKDLLAFFEKQRERSPRDVRWAVAVRDLRRDFHQVDGALEAAKAAVSVRPEREDLWREAADLFVRADRVKEAADYLEGWNRPRPADENVARWRSLLYLQAGESERALAIEQAALAAYAKEAAGDADGLAGRRARASEHLLKLGSPDLALRIFSPKSDIRDVRGSQLSSERQVQIALLTNQFLRLLGQRSENERFLLAAAAELARGGRFEQREEVQTFLMRQLIQQGGQWSRGALNRWWPFVQRAELEQPLRVALGKHLLANRPGPWQSFPGITFPQRVGAGIVAPSAREGERWAFAEPDLNRLWAEDLARRNQSEALLAFLEPRWQDMLGIVRGAQPLSGASDERLAWASWLDDPAALDTWVRAAVHHPEKVRELAEIMGDRRRWDRFWVLAARHWDTTPLVAALPQEARLAWFRFWEPALPQDPVLLARRRAVEQVGVALGRLVQGAPGAAQDPLIAKLRGPRTVGEVLGRDGRWVWSEFALRRNAKGEVMEEGEARVIGQGADQGRMPGALWGDRPGEAWYALEALARLREGDHTAAFLPLDTPQRGSEMPRVLLALRLARAQGDLPLALALEAEHPGPAHDKGWLEGRIALLIAAGQKARAAETFRAFVLGGQATLTEEEFRWLATRAEDWGLDSPLGMLDPARPVGPAFLAYLRDRKPEAAERFTTADPSGYRAALAYRWQNRESQLTADQVRYWLKELWAKDSAPLPRRGLAKLGGPWPHAFDWLYRQSIQDRLPAVQALEEALAGGPEPRLFGLLEGDDASRLAVRVRLARRETEAALALVNGMLAGLRRQGEELSFAPAPSTPSIEEGGEDEGSAAPPEVPAGTSDPLVDRLKAWLAPFQDAKQSAAVEERFRALLKERRQRGQVSTAAWTMAFQLAPAGEAQALAQELDEAWFRGEIPSDELGALSSVLAKAFPAEAPRWLARWPRSHGFEQARARAAILATLKQPVEAARTLFESRRRILWPVREEIEAFDTWRRMGAPQSPAEKAPAYWAGSLPAWTGKPEAVPAFLAERLRGHGLDLLAARAALRSLAPADEEVLARAGLALAMVPRDGEGEDRRDGDQRVLRLRAARGLLPQSAQAAGAAREDPDPKSLARLLAERRFRTADINEALADVARIARRSGDDAALDAALRALADRNAPNAKALRAELAADTGKSSGFHHVDGRPALLRPRDLTWALVSNILKTEGIR